MSIKAELKIQLFANDVIVAESNDSELWQKVLSIVQGEGNININSNDSQDVEDDSENFKRDNDLVQALADEIGVPKEHLIGSCDPQKEAPYIHLDFKSWEKFKKNTPSRGTKAVSPLQLSGTILCLWYEILGAEERPHQSEAQAVLKTINLRDKNASRSIKNCDWLQNRNGELQINPIKYSKAISVLQAYITQSEINYD